MTRSAGIEAAVLSFDDGRLHALVNPYAVDGRVSWHPATVRGFAPMNCYLLAAGRRAMLIDSGMTVHRGALLAQLDRLLGAGTVLRVLHTRLGEYNTLCNTPAVVERFDLGEICGAHVNADLWTDFEPHRDGDASGFAHAIDGVEVRVLGGDQTLHVDTAGERTLHVFQAALRLLPTHWAYDDATKTLFTSDMFTHVHRSGADGPWLVTAADDDTTLETVRDHMLGGRYWWLPGARTEEIAAQLDEVFESHRVERIAPGYGCILDGAEVVDRHLAMVQEVLASGSHGVRAAFVAASGATR